MLVRAFLGLAEERQRQAPARDRARDPLRPGRPCRQCGEHDSWALANAVLRLPLRVAAGRLRRRFADDGALGGARRGSGSGKISAKCCSFSGHGVLGGPGERGPWYSVEGRHRAAQAEPGLKMATEE